MVQTYGANGGDLRLTETANVLLHRTLVDLTDLYSLLVNLGDQAGRGSTVDQISTVTLTDAMTAPAEGGTTGVVDPTFGSVTVTIARQQLRRQITDLLKLTSAPGMWALNPMQVAEDARNSITLRRTGLAAALFAAITNSVGASGVDLTVTNIFQAKFQLQTTRNTPRFACVLHPVQMHDFETDLRGETGPLQWISASPEMLRAKGPGFAGSWLNIDFYTSDQVATANGGADRQGAMFAPGFAGFKEASARNLTQNAGTQMLGVSPFAPAWIEISRTPSTGVEEFNYNYYTGVAEIEDNRAVDVTTDA